MHRPITCIPTGAHWGLQRFPNLNDEPRLKLWRCELTGLSQVYNLYFVACNDKIHVHQPSFPDQKITAKPELILHPPIVSPVYGRGIDPVEPHSITRLHIDYLGQDEILLVTCDDGDVIGYRVKHIQDALVRRRASGKCTLEPVHEDEVKVFLRRNVGASAWGLAVHREARMIAISANTHEITIISYALVDPSSPSDDTASESLAYSKYKPAKDSSNSRECDDIIVLRADSNTPAVAFNNTGDDPTGRWLISSSIDGKTMIWDLYGPPLRPRLARTIRLGWCASKNPSIPAPRLGPGFCSCIDRTSFPHAAWGAMTLNTQSAYEMPYAEAMLQKPELVAPCFMDITRDVLRFTIRLESPFIGPPSLTMDDTPDDEDNDNNEMVISESGSEGDTTTSELHPQFSDITDVFSDTTDVDPSIAMMLANRHENATESIDEAEAMHTSEDGDDELDDDSVMGPHESSPQESEVHSSSPSTFPPLYPLPANVLPEAQPTSITIDLIANLSNSGSDSESEPFVPPDFPERHAFCDISTRDDSFSSVGSTDGPCLIVNKGEIYFFQRSFKMPLVDDFETTAIISMRRPLHPEPWARTLSAVDRMCFLKQIPELGVFIVASPIGRAGVYSIYWTREKEDAKPQWGCRLEYLLPFEKRDDRRVYCLPGTNLIGVSVGPIQGMFDKPGDTTGEVPVQPRRWRVLMYYTDHTVLSFELSKSRLGSSPTVSELVV